MHRSTIALSRKGRRRSIVMHIAIVSKGRGERALAERQEAVGYRAFKAGREGFMSAH
jgi:hypothetical protein